MIRSKHTIDDPALDPAVAAELEMLEAALRGDAIEDETLAALVRDVQAQAPEMPDDLRKRLRHEVADGFPRRGRALRMRAAGQPRASRRRPFLAVSGALATVAAVVMVVGIAGSETPKKSLDLGSTASSSSKTVAETVTLDSATSEAPTTDSTSSGVAAATGKAAAPSAAPQRRSPESATNDALTTRSSAARKVERTVDMTVRVKSGKLSDAVGKVGQIARQDGGYVADSSTALRTRGAGSASFTLRVATAKLDDAVARLSALGTVTQQDQQSTDITSSFDSAQQRLKDATAVRRALLRALAKATTAGEIASLKSRIADNRTTRARLDAQLSALNRRADLTTITLSLTAPTSGAAAAIDDNGTWSLGDALRDTGHILGTVTGGLLVAAGALLPFGILALIAWPIYRLRRRASREAALGN